MRFFNGCAESSNVIRASMCRVEVNRPGAVSTIPRRTSSSSTPAKFNAVRCPAKARSIAFPPDCTPRMRSSAVRDAPPLHLQWLPDRKQACPSPPCRIPSSQMRGQSADGNNALHLSAELQRRRGQAPDATHQGPCRCGSSRLQWERLPETIRAEILPPRAVRISLPGSTVSAFVSTIIPRGIPSSRQISKCSRVCGLMPSFAAMTSSTTSIPPAPASMFLTNRSCPGTSTKPRRTPASSRNAKPRSIVMPRRRSSSNLSGCVPVNASTSADLPWSMCPAVPTITFLIVDIGGLRDGLDAASHKVSAN